MADSPDLNIFMIDHRDLIVPGPQERASKTLASIAKVWKALPLAGKIILVFSVVMSPAVLFALLVNVYQSPEEWSRLCMGTWIIIASCAMSAWAAFGFVSPVALVFAALTGVTS